MPSTFTRTQASLSRGGRSRASRLRVPDTDVKILATALALGIIIDPTIVRGILAPVLVAALGDVNWWWPRR